MKHKHNIRIFLNRHVIPGFIEISTDRYEYHPAQSLNSMYHMWTYTTDDGTFVTVQVKPDDIQAIIKNVRADA